MRNFIIILFILFLLFLIGSLFIADPLIFFLFIFLGFVIGFICLIFYLGKAKGLLAMLVFIFLPFLIEYLFFWLNIPFFETPLIQNLSFSNINLPITLNTLFFIFTIPLLFISALFFAQKIKLFANLKKYHKNFIAIISSLLIALNFLILTQNLFEYKNFIKWLIIALIVNFLIAAFYRFRAEIPEIYKELPIILYLAIYGAGALKQLNAFNLIVTIILTLFYLLILYNEYKIRKISQGV